MKKTKKLLLWLAAAAMMCSLLSAAPVMAETVPETTEITKETETETEKETDLPETEGEYPAFLAGEEIQGTFVLVGDQAHGDGGHGEYQIWLEVPFTAQAGQTVYDILDKVLNEAGYTYAAPDSGYGKYLTTVTSPSGVSLSAGTNGTNSGWMYYVNNISPAYSMDKAELKDGDRVQILYVDDWSSDSRIDENDNLTGETDQKQPGYEGTLPQYSSEWSSYRGNASNNGIVSALTPVSSEDAGLKWTAALKDPSDWATNLSDPLIVNGQIYIAAGDRLKVLDQAGNLLKEGALSEKIGYTCRLAYSDGLILVPQNGGGVQALAADTLKTVWTASGFKIDDSHQALTTLTCADGIAYLGTAVADWSKSYEGVFRAIDLSDGKMIWEHENKNAGYYWSGAAAAEGVVLFAGDDGVLLSLDAKTGAEKARLQLSSGVRSSVVTEGGFVYAVSTDGTLHQVALRSDGTFGTHRSVQFAAYSTSTPAVTGGKAYVGGSQSDYSGILAEIDLTAMTVVQTAAAEKEVKSAPLVSTGNQGQTCVYYTSNITPGAIYVFCPETGSSETLFVPQGDQQNYCMASVMADSAGTLYYTNDSGTLFAIKNTGITEPESSTAESSTEETGMDETGTEENSTEEASSAENQTGTGNDGTEAATETAQDGGETGESPATGDPFGGTLLLLILLVSGTVLFVSGRTFRKI